MKSQRYTLQTALLNFPDVIRLYPHFSVIQNVVIQQNITPICSSFKSDSEKHNLNTFKLIQIQVIHVKLRHPFFFWSGDKIVSVFITRAKGEELAALVDNGTRITMQISVGSHYTYRFTNINRSVRYKWINTEIRAIRVLCPPFDESRISRISRPHVLYP